MMRRRQHRSKTVIVVALAIVAAAILIIYFYFAHYFKSHFYFNAELNGLNVGGMTAEEAQDVIASETEDYLLTIYDRDGNKYHIKGYDIDYEYVSSGEEAQIIAKQNSFAWPFKAFKNSNEDLQIAITFDETKLAAAVSALECFAEENITAPEDAYIEETDSGFQIVEEVAGNQLKEDAVQAQVKEAVTAEATELTLEDADYEAPAVTSTDETLTSCMSTISQYLSSSVVYEIGGYDEKVTSDTIASWLNVSEDYSVDVDTNAIATYVQSLASKYNTYGDTRDFTTSVGDVVQIGGGDYGWVIDKDAEAAQLLEDISSGETVTREPEYSQTAVQRDGLDDIGNTYVEIDYTNQHLYFYKEGELVVDTDIVSGNISQNNGSPDGVFKIVYKKSPAVLKGENYESNVTYFMPFAYNVGIHDASWRNGQFGGEIYKTSGSHGCINVSEEAATTIFNTIETGTPVIAYYREAVQLTAENCQKSNAYSYVELDAEEDGTETAATE